MTALDPTAPRRLPGTWLLIVMGGGLAGLAAVAAGLLAGTGLEEQWRLAARYTARTGAALFLLPFLAGPLAKAFRGPFTRGLRRNRRYLGLAFGFAHFIHLGALIAFYQVSGLEPSAQTVAGGGLAYVLIGLMALTSNDAAVRLLGRNWRRLHLVGLYYVWFIFAFTYFGRTGDPAAMVQGVVGTAVFIAALAFRLWANRR